MQGLVVVHQQIYVDLEEAHVLLIVIVKEIWCVIIGLMPLPRDVMPMLPLTIVVSDCMNRGFKSFPKRFCLG